MSVVDNQIRQRKSADNAARHAAQQRLRDAVDPRLGKARKPEGDLPAVVCAINAILSCWGLSYEDMPRGEQTPEAYLDYLMHHQGIGYHKVMLTQNWHKRVYAPMVVLDKSDCCHAVLSGSFLRPRILETESGRWRPLSAAQARSMGDCTGYELFRPFPQELVEPEKTLRWLLSGLDKGFIARLLLCSIFIAAMGAAYPAAVKLIFSEWLPSGNAMPALGICAALLGFACIQALIQRLRNGILLRESVPLAYAWRSALMLRILYLPESFFRRYSSSATLAQIVQGGDVPQLLIDQGLGAATTAACSSLGVAPLFYFSESLALCALGAGVASAALAGAAFAARRRMMRSLRMDEDADEKCLTTMLRAVQKIKTTGAQSRSFDRWTRSFARTLQDQYAAPVFLRLGYTPARIVLALALVPGFIIAGRSGADAGSLLAFQAALGILSASLFALFDSLEKLEGLIPFVELIKPILKQPVETSDVRKLDPQITGDITLENVRFRYGESKPWILDGLSLHIKAGEYIGIVGKSECGKSTLLRLLLGFENAERGAIYYGSADISRINLHTLRRQIGVVTQGDNLFSGTLYHNISIAKPGLSMEKAWEAARFAELDEDIRSMPMGMETFMRENGGVSGGQRQRMLIARAVAAKPRLLILDEATSALDNLTQKRVMDNLAKLKCTRIVVAHRLSTVAQCDRILMLDKGKIIEEGSYEELIRLDGEFKRLVERQQVKS